MTSDLPSGLNATDLTQPDLVAEKVLIRSPVATSQS